MNGFMTTYALEQAVLNPYKRVNYTPGLVLGVDEFVQDQAYYIERDQLHARALHGYGTISGLQVRIQDNVPSGAKEIFVGAGLAQNPLGQVIRVLNNQCAQINPWLASVGTEELIRQFRKQNKTDDNPEPSVTDDNRLSIYVVLCSRECTTDKVPVPGGPCRSQDDSMTDSRISDDFDLKLTFEPPNQNEEHVVNRLGDILRWVRISDATPAATEEQLLALLRSTVTTFTPPSTVLNLPSAAASALLEAMFRVWITEVRPLLLYTVNGPVDAERCVLLARVNLRLSDVFQLINGMEIEVDEQSRPLLIHTRLLQEWLHNSITLDAAKGDLKGVYPTLEIAYLQGNKVDALTPNRDDVLSWNGSAWVPAAGGGGGAPADLNPYYLLDGSRPLAGTLNAGGNQLKNLGAATDPSDAVRLDQVLLQNNKAGGDLTGNYPDPIVAQLQGRPVSDADPGKEQVLTWDGNQWLPAPIQVAGGGAPTGPAGEDLSGTYPNPSVARLRGIPLRALGPINNQMLTFQDGQWTPAFPLVEGDLAGTYPRVQVAGLRNHAISPTPPQNNQVLTWQNRQWTPAFGLVGERPVSNQQPGTGDVLTWNGASWSPGIQSQATILPLATITPLGDAAFEIWFNLDAPGNQLQIQFLEGLEIFAETEERDEFLLSLGFNIFANPRRNVFFVQLDQAEPLLRFVFNLSQLQLTDGRSVAEDAKERRIWFEGQVDDVSVTRFVRATTVRLG